MRSEPAVASRWRGTLGTVVGRLGPLVLVGALLMPAPVIARPSVTTRHADPLNTAIRVMDLAAGLEGGARSEAVGRALDALRAASADTDARYASELTRVHRAGLPRSIARRAAEARASTAAWYAAFGSRVASREADLHALANELRVPAGSIPTIAPRPVVEPVVRARPRFDPDPSRIAARLLRRPDLRAPAGAGSELRTSHAIRALAHRLGPDPLAAVNWVRQHVLYRPGWGVVQGAVGCRRSLECDAQDTSGLLVALLREAGHQARFATGVLMVDPAFFDSAAGGLDNVDSAIYAAAVGGLDVTETTDDDGNDALVFPHVWVEVRRGAEWVPVDAALKRTRLIEPMSVQEMVGQDPEAVVEELRSHVTLDASLPAATGVDREPILKRIVSLTRGLQRTFARGIPARTTVGEVVGALVPRAARLRDLDDAAPPGEILEVASRGAALPDAQHHTVQITAPAFDGQGERLDVSFPLDDVVNRRLTFLFPAATAADRATIAEHGGLYSTPPYLLQLRPAVQLDGKVVATGDPAPMGFFQQINITLTTPTGDVTSISHVLRIGGFAALGLDPVHRKSADLRAAGAPIERTLRRLRHPTGRLTSDALVGQPLHAQAQLYWAIVDRYAHTLANQQGMRVVRFPGELLMTAQPAITFEAGVPTEIGPLGLSMDAQQIGFRGVSRGTPYDPVAEAAYLEGFGAYTSAVEHGIFELTVKARSASTVAVLERAARSGNPIFGITSHNSALIDQLDAPDNVKANVRAYVQSGLTVFIPRDPVTIKDWTGWGWVVQNYDTGLYAYLLAGNLHGGATTQQTEILEGLGQSLNELAGDTAEFYLEHQTVIKNVDNVTKWLGPGGAGISGGIEYIETYEETGSVWKAGAAGVTKTVAQLTADTAMAAYVGAGATAVTASAAGGPVGVGVAATVVVTTGVGLGYVLDQTVEGITEFAEQAAPQ